MKRAQRAARGPRSTCAISLPIPSASQSEANRLDEDCCFGAAGSTATGNYRKTIGGRVRPYGATSRRWHQRSRVGVPGTLGPTTIALGGSRRGRPRAGPSGGFLARSSAMAYWFRQPVNTCRSSMCSMQCRSHKPNEQAVPKTCRDKDLIFGGVRSRIGW